MKFQKLIDYVPRISIGFVVGITLLLVGCGGGGSSSTSAQIPPVLPPVIVIPVPQGAIISTNGLVNARYSHTANLLFSGKINETVLVTGGYGAASGVPVALASTELYDPVAKTWTTSGNLNVSRFDHTSTRLQNEQVLVTGGENYIDPNYIRSAELFDPTKGTWAYTGQLASGRSSHTATKLVDGNVLVTGGVGDGGINLASSELYNYMTKTWSSTGSLITGRNGQTATLLSEDPASPMYGKVLVVGGLDTDVLASSEIYDPTTKQWSSAGDLHIGRYGHTATLLSNGKVLVVGGVSASGIAINTVELYDPAASPSQAWIIMSPLQTARALHTATLLTTGVNAGKILIIGGDDFDVVGEISSIELYDPTLPGLSTILTTPLTTPRDNFTAILFPIGSVLAGDVLVIGGNSGSGAISSTEMH
jgi:hypothetical protein